MTRSEDARQPERRDLAKRGAKPAVTEQYLGAHDIGGGIAGRGIGPVDRREAFTDPDDVAGMEVAMAKPVTLGERLQLGERPIAQQLVHLCALDPDSEQRVLAVGEIRRIAAMHPHMAARELVETGAQTVEPPGPAAANQRRASELFEDDTGAAVHRLPSDRAGNW